jgi:hypothetical protein
MKELSGTLLGQFVDKKLRSYVGPKKGPSQRGGSFSLNKYLLSLMLLTSTPRKRMVKGLTTEQVLKNWMMDENFSGLVQQHIRDFSEFWIEKVIEENNRMKGDSKEHELSFNFMNRLHQEGTYYDLQTWVGIVKELRARTEIDPSLLPYLRFGLRFKATLMEKSMKGRHDRERLLKEMDWIEKEASLNDLESTLEILKKENPSQSEKDSLIWRFETEAKLVREDFEKIDKELKETP